MSNAIQPGASRRALFAGSAGLAVGAAFPGAVHTTHAAQWLESSFEKPGMNTINGLCDTQKDRLNEELLAFLKT